MLEHSLPGIEEETVLSREDNELLTNTDKGSPMGEVFRRFWIPVAISEELPGPDCVPVKPVSYTHLTLPTKA